MRQVNRGRHIVFGFIGGVTEHHALVAGAAGVHAHGDIARLLVDAGDDGAGVGIKSIERIVIANGLHYAADSLLKVDISFGGDFAGDDHQASGCQRFAGDAAVRIFCNARIQNRV
jgi:hypothetical protein